MANHRKDGRTGDLRPLCACGCGERVRKYRADYLLGHERLKRMRERGDPPACACGCGLLVPAMHGRPWIWQRYVHNHHLKGEAHHFWNGGEVHTSKGYVWAMAKDHPRAKESGHVLRSHLVAEKTIGRYLRSGEEVHHVNHKKWDDRPENLMVLSKAAHARLHAAERRAQRRHKIPAESIMTHPGCGD